MGITLQYWRYSRVDWALAGIDPASDLAAHTALAADPTWPGRVIPTFRPDRYLEVGEPGWRAAVANLGAVADVDVAGCPDRPTRIRAGVADLPGVARRCRHRGRGDGFSASHDAGNGPDVV